MVTGGPGRDETGAGERRAACIALADLALRAAGGDPDAAKTMLAPALQAIGALPYDKAPGKYRYGAAG